MGCVALLVFMPFVLFTQQLGADGPMPQEGMFDDDEPSMEPADDDQPSMEPADDDEPSMEPADDDEPSMEPADDDEPSMEPADDDQPSTEPADDDQPSMEPADDDEPSMEPADDDEPSMEPADDDQPSTEPADDDQPSMEPADDDEPSMEPADDDEPSMEPADDDQPSTEPADDDEPSMEPADDDEPSMEPADDDEPSMEPADDDEPSMEPADDDEPSMEPAPVVQPRPQPHPRRADSGEPRSQPALRVVPSLIGFSAKSAKSRLLSAGFSQVSFVLVAEPPPSRNWELTVARQSPLPGSRANPEDAVTAYIYGKGIQPDAKPRLANRAVPQAGAFHKIELLDANAEFVRDFSFPLPGGPPAINIQTRLAAMTETRQGAAADGVSLLLVRAEVDGQGRVAFSLEGPEKGGSLWDIASFAETDFQRPGNPTVETPVYPLGGKFYAFALYKPPIEFGPFPPSQQSRKFTVKAEHKPAAGAPSQAGGVNLGPNDCPIVLVRPPVVLVHGTYDDPDNCWKKDRDIAKKGSGQGLYQRLRALGFGDRVFAVDYRNSSGKADPSSIQFNRRVVWDGHTAGSDGEGIEKALKFCRGQGFAATQADLVAHSLGGVLARVYASNSYTQGWYHRKENFQKGDIHRLVTLCSTHRGSDVMWLMSIADQGDKDWRVAARIICYLFSGWVDWREQKIRTEAPLDQVPGSDALRRIEQTPMAVHAVACIASQQDVEEDELYRGRMSKIWNVFRPILVKPGVLEELLSKMGWDSRGTTIGLVSNLQTLTRALSYVQELRNLFPLSTSTGEQVSEAADKGRSAGMDMLRAAVFRSLDNNSPNGNDCTVSERSALGGLDRLQPQGKVWTEIQHVLHGDAPKYDVVQQKVIELLTGPQENFYPGGFPTYRPDEDLHPLHNRARPRVNGGPSPAADFSFADAAKALKMSQKLIPEDLRYE